MIRVSLWRGADGHLTGFRAEGHSGWARRGSDIVCAGVAALTQAAVLGIVQHLRLDAAITADDGLLECRLPATASTGRRRADGGGTFEQVDAILATMVLGLKEIALRYPRQVSIEERIEDMGERSGER